MRCLDAYALVEICKGSPGFAKLITDPFLITDLTMAEFYIVLYRKFSENAAEYWHKKLAFFCKPVSRELLIKALKYREDHKKENLSIFDCVGYIYALEHNIKFVTGDGAFQHKAGVEFIR